jgi:hypothetical protein
MAEAEAELRKEQHRSVETLSKGANYAYHAIESPDYCYTGAPNALRQALQAGV